MNDLLHRLAEPFAPEHLTWKPGMATKDGSKCLALAYADLRAYQERLDEVCGLDWSVEYQPWGDNRIIARLTIHGVTRSSTGEMGKQDMSNEMGGTVAEAQAMKRAAAQFGLGRYLYDLPSVWVEYDNGARKISKAGQEQLDSRYRAWYAKALAQHRASGPKRTAEPPTAHAAYDDLSQDEDFSRPPKPDNPFNDDDDNGDAPPTSDHAGDVLSKAQLSRLNQLGRKYYGAQWDTQRPKLVEAVSKGAVSSSKQLTPAEADTLIRGIEKRITEAAQAVQTPALNGAHA